MELIVKSLIKILAKELKKNGLTTARFFLTGEDVLLRE
jgi:hypothetical protein